VSILEGLETDVVAASLAFAVRVAVVVVVVEVEEDVVLDEVAVVAAFVAVAVVVVMVVAAVGFAENEYSPVEGMRTGEELAGLPFRQMFECSEVSIQSEDALCDLIFSETITY